MNTNNFNAPLWANAGIDVETAVERIVENGRDITSGYDNWLRLGFALADGRGEAGRAMYHRLSSMNAQYDKAECDRQYDACLRDGRREGSGVTVATLFQMAKDAGVSLSKEVCRGAFHHNCNNGGNGGGGGNCGGVPRMKTFIDKIAPDDLPGVIRQVADESHSTEEADMMVLGTMVAASAAMPGIYGVYDRCRVFAPLYACVVAPPASSKGRLAACVKFVQPIQDEIREANRREMEDYQRLVAEYQAKGRKSDAAAMPKEPPYRSLIVPANSSATAFYQAIGDNGGEGLTFETEGDVMAAALKSDYGDYSTGLRAAFHHEPITYNRRRDNEHVDISQPRWAVMLSGTPRQVANLVPDAENGLFSRFIFYMITRNIDWRDVFAGGMTVADDAMTSLGEKYLVMYHRLCMRRNSPVAFSFTQSQQEEFNAFFDALQREQASQVGDDMVASVRRLGLICFRLAMVLTVLRGLDGGAVEWGKVKALACDDRDFRTAMTMVNVLVEHTAMVLAALSRNDDKSATESGYAAMTERQRMVYDAMGDEFTTQELVARTAEINIPRRTAENMIGVFLTRYKVLTRVRNGLYRKVTGA